MKTLTEHIRLVVGARLRAMLRLPAMLRLRAMLRLPAMGRGKSPASGLLPCAAPLSCSPFLLLPLFLLLVPAARAQWQSTTYNLKGGWNSIYLHGEATYATIDTLFAERTEIIAIWRWNPNPSQIQFSSSSLVPTAGTPEWSVWTRGGSANTLTTLSGQAAYLVQCSGAATDAYSVPIVQKVLPPRSTWVRNGANFLGFPTRLTGSYPTLANYFATFPVAIATNSKIYRYEGGALGASNPVQVFSTVSETVDRTQAYWFESAIVGNFYAPLEVSPSNLEGLIYGRNGSLISVRVRNRTAAPVNLTVAPVTSTAAPVGQDQVTAAVPLTYRTFDTATAAYVFTPVTTAIGVVVGPQSTVELFFGVNRAQMTGATDALYASLLRFTEGGNLMDVYLPVSARVTSLSGLWIGDVAVSNVLNQTPAQRFVVDVTRTVPSPVTLTGGRGSGATATATLGGGALITLAVTNGGSGYTAAPTVSFSGGGGSGATATATILGGVVTGLIVDNGGSNYTSAPTVVLSSGGGTGATATAAVSVRRPLTALTVTNGGSGYTVAPAVVLSGGGGTGATATATISGGVVTGFTVANGGSNYTSAPSVSLAIGTGATATATVVSGAVTALTVTSGGSNYTTAPIVAVSGGTGAIATATLVNGSVTGFTITNGGSGYAPTVTSETGALAVQGASATLVPLRLPVGIGGALTYQWKKDGQAIADATASSLVLSSADQTASGAFGSTTPRSFPLRVILHVDDAGTARLLSHVFMGKLAAAPNNLGLCTLEAALKQDEKARAQRFTSAHLPLDTVVGSGTGSVGLGQTLERSIFIPHNAPTNPYVHTYHPDHDNRNARFDGPVSAGIESPAITRAFSFAFTTTPPSGTSSQGWGSSVIGGNYTEILSGIRKARLPDGTTTQSVTVSGTFVLRRVSELGSLTTN